jgi:hypothetical protein
LPTLEDAEAEANGGGFDNGQVIYVLEIQEYVIVYKPTSFTSIILRTRYTDPIIFEEDTDEGFIPNWTPGVIVTEGQPFEPVIQTDCSGILPVRQTATSGAVSAGGTNTNGTYIPGSRDDDNFGVEPTISDDVLISTGTVS